MTWDDGRHGDRKVERASQQETRFSEEGGKQEGASFTSAEAHDERNESRIQRGSIASTYQEAKSKHTLRSKREDLLFGGSRTEVYRRGRQEAKRGEAVPRVW